MHLLGIYGKLEGIEREHFKFIKFKNQQNEIYDLLLESFIIVIQSVKSFKIKHYKV